MELALSFICVLSGCVFVSFINGRKKKKDKQKNRKYGYVFFCNAIRCNERKKNVIMFSFTCAYFH